MTVVVYIVDIIFENWNCGKLVDDFRVSWRAMCQEHTILGALRSAFCIVCHTRPFLSNLPCQNA